MPTPRLVPLRDGTLWHIDEAEACWRDATRTLLRMQQGAQGGRGEAGAPREARAAAEQQAAAERLELQMCMADCLRCQGRFDESEVRAGAPHP